MIAVVQRVRGAAVDAPAEGHHAAIGPGAVVLLAVESGDGDAEVQWMARKIAHLRIFPDDAGRMNRSVRDVAGEILLISQFTLAGDCTRGNRPSFAGAAEPEEGRRLYERVGTLLESEESVPVGRGRFGAAMQVALVNDGPVTIILRTPRREDRPGL